MSGATRNPAQASVALTCRNYKGPNLLRTIHGKPSSSSPPKAVSPPRMSSAAKRESSADINTAPKSSDGSDEEASLPVEPAPAPKLDQIFKEIDQDTPKGKAAPTEERKGATRSTRSRQPRLKDEGPQLPSPPLAKSEPAREDELMDSWSQPNKRRKTLATYGRKSSQVSGGYKPVPALPIPAESATSTTKFLKPEISPHRPQSRTHSSRNKDFIAPPTLSTQTVRNKDTGPVFQMPGDLASDLTSSATTASESLPLFDLSDSPKFSTQRSKSSSSLSSLDSIASLNLTQERKEALRQGEDDESHTPDATTSRCPLCHSKVDHLHLETFKFGRRLNIRDQQCFCQEHKLRDAEKLWVKKKYPNINWLDITNDRIPKQIALLGRILNRTQESYYRDQLDAAMEEAKSRRGLQRYLTEGVVDIAKHGYYGPKGAKIMGRVITEHMSDALRQQLKQDKVARAAGVGGYVNAVLVPELAVRLVMEDMLLDDEGQARDVLSESANVGLLLNADDDESLTREEEEDDDDE